MNNNKSWSTPALWPTSREKSTTPDPSKTAFWRVTPHTFIGVHTASFIDIVHFNSPATTEHDGRIAPSSNLFSLYKSEDDEFPTSVPSEPPRVPPTQAIFEPSNRLTNQPSTNYNLVFVGGPGRAGNSFQ